MGKTTTPTYRVEYESVWVMNGPHPRRVHLMPSCWHGHHDRDRRATDENLARHVFFLEKSTEAGAPNAHLGLTRVGYAMIIRQATGEIVASYAAPEYL